MYVRRFPQFGHLFGSLSRRRGYHTWAHRSQNICVMVLVSSSMMVVYRKEPEKSTPRLDSTGVKMRKPPFQVASRPS